MTADKFRLRYTKHAQSFRNPKYSKETKLSRKVWEVGVGTRVYLKILKLARSYQPGMTSCRLCTEEKICILTHKGPANLLNSRTEIYTQCRHKNKHKMDRVLAVGNSQSTQGD